MREARLSVKAQRQNASGHAHRRLGGFERGCVGRAIFLDQLRRALPSIKLVRIGLVPARLDLGKLLLALKILVDVVQKVTEGSLLEIEKGEAAV